PQVSSRHLHSLPTRRSSDLDPARSRAVQCQAVRGGEQDLEEHEQVEQVAGEERAVQAHQQELEQGLEIVAAVLPAAKRCHQGRQDRKSTRLNSSHVKISYAV